MGVEPRRGPFLGVGARLAAVPSVALFSVAAYGNWQDAVADVPIALESFTVAETTVDAGTWLAMGCV